MPPDLQHELLRGGASSVRRGGAEEPGQRLLTERKDALDVALHHPAADPTHPRHELDIVDDAGAAGDRLEAVFVVPPAIRPDRLAIDEADAGFPYVDARAP